MSVWLINLHYLWRRPWQTGLAGLGIALGIAVVVAIQIAQQSARNAFDNAQDALFGRASQRIQADEGALPERVYRDLCLAFPELKVTPFLTASVKSTTGGGHWLEVVGFDALSALPSGQTIPADRAMLHFLMTPGTGVTSAATLRQVNDLNGVAHFARNGRPFSLTLRASTASGENTAPFPEALILLDLATAQDALGKRGLLSHIDFEIPESPAGMDLLAKIRAHVTGPYTVRDLRQERALRQGLSTAFETNLTALSLLALLIGMFLVYNTECFLILQRKLLFMRLRAIGVTRGEIFRAVVGESALLGALASAVGLGAGILLATELLELLTRTINNFYYPVHGARVTLAAHTLLLAWLAGVLATVLAALPAAREAAANPPIQRTVPPPNRRRRLLARKSVQSLLALGLAGTLNFCAPHPLWLDFLILALGLLAAALLIPGLLVWLSRQLTRLLVQHCLWPEQMGAENVYYHRARTGVAAAALCLAAAVSLGMLLMTASFRAAVGDWLHELLRADVYLSMPQDVPVAIAEQSLTRLKAKLQRHHAVSAVSSVTRREIMGVRALVQVAAYDLPTESRAGFKFLEGESTEIWRRWERDPIVIVSEPYAFHHQVRVGDTLKLQTTRGPVTFAIAGVYQDYASERGTVAMSLQCFNQYWPGEGISGIGVYFAPNTHFDEFRKSVTLLMPPDEPILIRRNRDLQALSLQIFDRTFAITKVLGAIAMGVSLVGIMGALLAQQLERARDYSVLRAIGVGRLQLFRIVLAQTLVIGLVAATGALPIGLGCAMFLVQVVNLHAFGWTMPITVSAGVLWWTWLGVLVAAVLAAIYPALQVIRTPPARALRYE